MSVLKRSFGVWSILDFWIRYIQLVLETTTSMGMLALQPPIVSHPMASTIPTVTASTAMAPGDLSPSGRCPSAPGIHGTGNEQSSHWNCWGSTMGSLTPLCTCTCSKNFHYKESLQKKKKDPAEPWGTKIQERNIQLKIGLFMRDILGSSEENNSLCGEGREEKLTASHVNNKSNRSSL